MQDLKVSAWSLFVLVPLIALILDISTLFLGGPVFRKPMSSLFKSVTMPKIEAVCKIENIADKPTRGLGIEQEGKFITTLVLRNFCFDWYMVVY